MALYDSFYSPNSDGFENDGDCSKERARYREDEFFSRAAEYTDSESYRFDSAANEDEDEERHDYGDEDEDDDDYRAEGDDAPEYAPGDDEAYWSHVRAHYAVPGKESDHESLGASKDEKINNKNRDVGRKTTTNVSTETGVHMKKSVDKIDGKARVSEDECGKAENEDDKDKDEDSEGHRGDEDDGESSESEEE
jgi:hypothetical protein